MMLERLDTVIAFAVIMLGVSLLITVATQMISSFLGLRGTNLLWGIKTILQDSGISATADKLARKLAREILTDPMISDSVASRVAKWPVIGYLTRRWRLASAIRPAELSRVLAKIQVNPKNYGGPVAAKAIQGAIQGALSAWPDLDPAALDKIHKLQTAFTAAGTNWTMAADKVVQQMADSASQSISKLETSFNTAMDRVSQRFAMSMRFATIILAFVVAFGVHLDSVQLLKKLAMSPEQRNALVSMRDVMLKQAETVSVSLPSAAPASGPVVAPGILKEAMDNLKKAAPDSHLPAAPDFASYAEAANWLRSNNQGALEPRYQQAVATALQQHATDINNQLLQSGFRLIPSPYSLWPLCQDAENLIGILISAAFLSLGAPFWFNTLKGLSSLRTVVADNEAKGTGKA
jgi:hypothetical protein